MKSLKWLALICVIGAFASFACASNPAPAEDAEPAAVEAPADAAPAEAPAE